MFSGGGSHPNWLARRHENVILPPPADLFSSFSMPSSQQPYSGQPPQSLFPIKEPMASGYGGLFPPQLGAQGTPTPPGRVEEFPPVSAAELHWTPWAGHPIAGKNAPFPAATPANGLPPFSNATASHPYPTMNVSNGYPGYHQQRNSHSPYPARNTQSPYAAGAATRNAHSPYSSQTSHGSPYPSSRNAQSPYSPRNSHSPYGSRNAQSPYSMNANSPYSSHNSPSPYSGQSGHSPGYSKQNISDNDFQLMLGGAFLGTRLSSEMTDANSAPGGGMTHQDGLMKDPTKRLTHLPHPNVRAGGGSVVGSPQAKSLDDQGRLSHPSHTSNVMFDPARGQQQTTQAQTVATSTGSSSSNNKGSGEQQPPQASSQGPQKNATFLPNSPQKLSHPPIPPRPASQNFSPPKNMASMAPFPGNATNHSNNASPALSVCSVPSQESTYAGNFGSDRGTPHSNTSQSYEETPNSQQPQEASKNSPPASQNFSETTPLSHEYKDFNKDFKHSPKASQQQQQHQNQQEFDEDQAIGRDFSEGRPLSQLSQGYNENHHQQQQQQQPVSRDFTAAETRPMSQGYVDSHNGQQNAQGYPHHPQRPQVSQGYNEDHNNHHGNMNSVNGNLNQGFDTQSISQSDDAISFSDGGSLTQSFNGSSQGFPGNVENGTMAQNGPLGPSGPMAHAVPISQSFVENPSLSQNFDLGRQTSPNLALMSNYSENHAFSDAPSFADAPSFMTPTYAGSESHDSFPEDSDIAFTPKKVETPAKGKKSKKQSHRTPRKDDALIEITGVVEDSARRVRGAKGTLTAEEVFEYLGQKTNVCSFQCHYDSCKERFLDVAVYIQHCLQQHQAYICHECGKDFTTKSSLLRHRHIHTGLHRFACSICKKTFYRKDKCRAHIKRHLMEGNKGAVEDVCVPAPRK